MTLLVRSIGQSWSSWNFSGRTSAHHPGQMRALFLRKREPIDLRVEVGGDPEDGFEGTRSVGRVAGVCNGAADVEYDKFITDDAKRGLQRTQHNMAGYANVRHLGRYRQCYSS